MLKKFSVWKKMIFAILCLGVFIRILFIFALDEVERQYDTPANIETGGMQEIPCKEVIQKFISENDRLYKIELMFNGIAEDRLGIVTLSITSNHGLVYQTNLSLANINNLEWKQVFLNMPIDRGQEYEISLDAQGCSQIPNLLLVPKERASEESAGSFSGNTALGQEIAVKYGYLTEPSVFDKVMSSFVWILFLAGFYLILAYVGQVKDMFCKIGAKLYRMECLRAILITMELMFCLVFIGCSGIQFQEATKIIFYLVSITAAWNLKVTSMYVEKLLDTAWKKIGLCFLYFYGAFALVGQRIFIYPLNLKITPQSLFVFLITMLWMVPVVHGILYGCAWMSRRLILGDCRRMKASWFLGVLLLFLLVPAVFHLYANNPGITSPDTLDCMITNAHHLKGMYDWHPFFYCFVLRVILGIWDSTYAVIFVQYFFWAYVMAEGILYLRKKGMRDGFLLAAAFLSGCNAGNFIHLNTIWKDVPYTLSVLWAVILLGKLVLDAEEYKGKWYIYLELAVALSGIYFYRKNGVVAFLVIAAATLLLLYQNVKTIGTLAMVAAIIVLVKGPVYSYFEVADPGRHGMYIGLSQDILGVYYAGGEVSEETLQMINVMTENNNAEYNYSPTWSWQSYDLSVEPTDFVKNYVITFLRNPVLMSRAVIAREDAVWNIFLGEGATLNVVNYTGTMDGDPVWNSYYPVRKYNSFYPGMSSFTAYTASSQWINALEWRCGAVMFLSLIAVFLVVCSLKGRRRPWKYFVILAPSLGHMLSLVLSTGWADFRYFWPLNLNNIFILLFAMVFLHQKNSRWEILDN